MHLEDLKIDRDQVALAGLALAVVGVPLAVVLVAVSNPLLTFVDMLAIAAIWWGAPGAPLRIATACLLSIEWLQASSKIWIANLLGLSLTEPSTTAITTTNYLEVTSTTSPAILLALAAIIAVSIGARLLMPSLRLNAGDFARYSPLKLFAFYLPLLFASQLAGPYFGGSLAQLVNALGGLRFVPIVLMIGVWFYTKRGGRLLLAVCGLELAIGFLGYFSDWKSILILAAVAIVAVAGEAWRRALPLMAAGIACMLAFGTIWTIVKPSYREALNGDSGQQVVMLSPLEQANALTTGVRSVKTDELSEGFLDLLMRISYVDYLADAMAYVPARVEHQHGQLWGEALQQLVMPRFLFPDKAPLPSDSERTMQYTGQHLATGGTSISIGYVGDSYIDFGVLGTLAICLALGASFSAGVLVIYKFSRGARDAALVLGLSISFLWPLQLFETSNVKLMGSAVWAWIGCIILVGFAWPYIAPLLRAKDQRAPYANSAPSGSHSRGR